MYCRSIRGTADRRIVPRVVTKDCSILHTQRCCRRPLFWTTKEECARCVFSARFAIRSSMSSFAAGTDAVGMGGRIAISTLARLSLLRRTCRHGCDGERLLSCGVRPSLQDERGVQFRTAFVAAVDRYFKRGDSCASLWRPPSRYRRTGLDYQDRQFLGYSLTCALEVLS